MSDSSQPHGLQPTRLLHAWDFPGKSTGVGCHCLLRNTSLLVGKICTAQGPLSDSPPPHVHNLLSSLPLLWGHPGLSSRLTVSCWWLLWLVSVQAILLITYFQCLCYRMRLDMVILICRWRTGSLRQYGRLSFSKLAPIIVPSTHAVPEPCHFPIRVGIHLPSPRTWGVGVKGCVTVSMSRMWQKKCCVTSGTRSAKQASLVAQLVKNLPALWETWVWSLGWEDCLEKRKATHSSILAWRITWHVVTKSQTWLSDFHFFSKVIQFPLGFLRTLAVGV